MKQSIELSEYIHPPAVRDMRSAIGAAGGNEVFFLGRTDQELVVQEVSVLAMGDGVSVPAVTRSASISDAVIHNHPDGGLTPSRADLAVAAELGNRGVGFYIVDNTVERIYPVVFPSAREERVPLDLEKLSSYLRPDGAVAAVLKDYEYRGEQCGMLEVVVRAFNDERVALIEAGTGTGKSLAYLIPAISWSLANKERVVISTNTINLQEQLIGKDIPLLLRVCGLQCRAVIVKGRNNYLCLRKLAALREERRLLLAIDAGDEIDEIVRWAEKTADGSLADLSFMPRPDAWERVSAEADQCTRLHCSFYGNCFFYKSRRAASSAHVLVVNHHLLMADLAVRNRTGSYEGPAVLPRFHRLVIDEAQHLEDVATEYLGFTLTKYAFLKILRRLQSAREGGRGLLAFLAAKLHAEEGEGEAIELISEVLLPERHALEDRIRAAFERAAAEVKRHAGERGADNAVTLRITPATRASAFWQQALCPVVRELLELVEPFAGRLHELLKLLGALPERAKKALEGPCVELAAMRRRLDDYLQCLQFFMKEEDSYCRWCELKRGRREERLSFCAAPLDVAKGLRESLYERFGTVVMTSATLTVGGQFDYFRARAGLDGLGEGKLECAVLPSPFDYRAQALVAAPSGIAEPDSPGYEQMLEEAIGGAVSISRGRAFVLFTSYRLLEELYGRLAARLGDAGLIPLKQGSDHRTALLNRFRRESGAVLFATDSFWEGVDVKGEALECVIITRLPFRVPSEPIQQARMEAIAQAGGDPFMDYSVPQAVIKFRQGFGRLIRHRDDIGVVLILDARVHTRRYGGLFLRSLPSDAIHGGSVRDCMAAMKQFFERAPRAAMPKSRGAGRKSMRAGRRARTRRR